MKKIKIKSRDKRKSGRYRDIILPKRKRFGNKYPVKRRRAAKFKDVIPRTKQFLRHCLWSLVT